VSTRQGDASISISTSTSKHANGVGNGVSPVRRATVDGVRPGLGVAGMNLKRSTSRGRDVGYD
jgi:hypothetical protein